jgi:isopentenyl-diphosphate delta-isomerase
MEEPMSVSTTEPLLEEMLVLVDDLDNEVGVAEKLSAHREGKLHRAVSVFLFNDKGQMLLQQRAFSKYHSGGLWTNTCCGHPRPGELPLVAAKRRLFEEMGICTGLEKILDFTYKAVLDEVLMEHEFDHVFSGRFNCEPHLNSEEACDWKWMDIDKLEKDVIENPGQYTVWFKIILKKVVLRELQN